MCHPQILIPVPTHQIKSPTEHLGTASTQNTGGSSFHASASAFLLLSCSRLHSFHPTCPIPTLQVFLICAPPQVLPFSSCLSCWLVCWPQGTLLLEVQRQGLSDRGRIPLMKGSFCRSVPTAWPTKRVQGTSRDPCQQTRFLGVLVPPKAHILSWVSIVSLKTRHL